MDLLGSILSSMDKPPEVDEKRKEQIKSKLHLFLSLCYCVIVTHRNSFYSAEQKEQLEKQQAYEKHEMARFRTYCEERVDRFLKDEKRPFLQFQPLNRLYRSIV